MKAIEAALRKIENSDDLLIQVEGDFALRDLVFQLNLRDYQAVIIDRAPVFNRETLMHALYQSLRLPGYFGFNWDALKDILSEIAGVPGKELVLAFSDLSLLSEEVRSVFLEVVAEANENRSCHESLKRLRVVALRA